MKTFTALIFMLLSAPVFAQGPVIENAENFEIGTTLVFQQCGYDTVNTALSGPNQIWDFSDLQIKKGQTTTEIMVRPEETAHGEDYPLANIVEKMADGRYVYVVKKEGESLMTGFVGNSRGMTISYKKPVLIAKRPIKYGDTLKRPFTAQYHMRQMDFKGQGTATLVADAYGQLRLPNKTYDHVLRIKVNQVQTDSLPQYGMVFKMKTKTYVWFDKAHASALLKISKTTGQYHNSRVAEYLVKETD